MSTKKLGILSTSSEWAKLLRRFHKRKFWKGDRKESIKVKTAFQKDLPHPGEIISELYIIPLFIEREQLPLKLNLSENDVTRLLRGELAITDAIAERLSKVFGTSKKYWLNLQEAYDHSKIR